jgi:hypothetical protein
MVIPHTQRLCSLEVVVGKDGVCPEEACPFWEPGGAALGGRCAVDELGGVTDPAVSAWLLEIREKLLAASSEENERAMRAVFHQLLNSTSE